MADQALDIQMLRHMPRETGEPLPEARSRPRIAGPVCDERRACYVLSQPRSSQRRKAKLRDAVVKRMLELVRVRPRFGYRRIAALLREEGFRASATRISPTVARKKG